jgi:hypothetical protein
MTTTLVDQFSDNSFEVAMDTVAEIRAELNELIRLSHRLDYLSAKRVQEIAAHLLQIIGE